RFASWQRNCGAVFARIKETQVRCGWLKDIPSVGERSERQTPGPRHATLKFIVDNLHNNCVDCLRNGSQAAIPDRSAAGHARPPHLAYAADWPCSRPCHRETHSADHRRPAAGRDRFLVSGAASVGGEGLDCGVVGTLRQREAGEILPAHSSRPETARERALEMAGVCPRHELDVEPGRSGGLKMTFFRKLLGMVQRRRREAELREELEFHLEEEAEERRGDGFGPEQARWAAHRDLGNVTLVRENVRAVWIWSFWERLLQDLRYAWRMMMASKIFSALAILS